jgi:MFS family permease
MAGSGSASSTWAPLRTGLFRTLWIAALVSINVARAIGPAIGGLLVARIGVAAVFGLNTATFVLYAIVLACHPRLGGPPRSSERFIPGLRAGGRYARHAPVVQRILLPESSLPGALQGIPLGSMGESGRPASSREGGEPAYPDKTVAWQPESRASRATRTSSS